MTDDVTARPWWRWMAGMRWHLSADCLLGGHDLGRTAGRVDDQFRAVDDAGHTLTSHDRITPDPTDPATLGCLLGLAREMWVDPHLSPWWSHCDEIWYVRSRRGYVTVRGESEWSALVAACDAAWGRQ